MDNDTKKLVEEARGKHSEPEDIIAYVAEKLGVEGDGRYDLEDDIIECLTDTSSKTIFAATDDAITLDTPAPAGVADTGSLDAAVADVEQRYNLGFITKNRPKIQWSILTDNGLSRTFRKRMVMYWPTTGYTLILVVFPLEPDGLLTL